MSNKKQWDIMLDLETLGTRPDAAIIQIGAVLFEPKSGGKIDNANGFNQHVIYQDGSGSVDHGTLGFWCTEKNVKRMGENMQKKAEFLPKVLSDFTAWPVNVLGSWDAVGRIWAKPSVFDVTILRSAFIRTGTEAPWNLRSPRDCYTVFDLVGGAPEVDWTGLVAHDAFDDAVGQAMQKQKAAAILDEAGLTL